MNKEKQIEEMADIITDAMINGAENFVDCVVVAVEELYAKGYRKASEIFAEIETEIEAAIESNYRAKKEHKNHSVIPNYDNFNAMCDGKIYAMRGLLDFIAELKKKYTESEKEE